MLFWAAVDKGTLEDDLDLPETEQGKTESKGQDSLSSSGGFNSARGGS